MKEKISLFWFRRDLSTADNIGLCRALSSGFPVLPLFIFDPGILLALESRYDRRVDYIQQALHQINYEFKAFGSSLYTFYGTPLSVFEDLAEKYAIQAVFCNHDEEPQAIARDNAVAAFFSRQEIPFRSYKNQVIFERNDILKQDGKPYTVFTPYAKKWKAQFAQISIQPETPDFGQLFRQPFKEVHSLADLGFNKTDILFVRPQLPAATISRYAAYRDYPALQQTTQLGMALRFGTISIRTCVSFAWPEHLAWLNELIWREFFMQILYHFPQVTRQAFHAKYERLRWRNNEQEFEKWCEGKTGYPLVDAGMRQLNATGYMHNRVRMITAGFLCKHLLIDWRWGEAYFAKKLNDYDLAANNGNWQWAAGTGCDAAPYFRIFNPLTQAEKFDKKQEYIKKWLPEWGTAAYPEQIVAHAFARERALKTYREIE